MTRTVEPLPHRCRTLLALLMLSAAAAWADPPPVVAPAFGIAPVAGDAFLAARRLIGDSGAARGAAGAALDLARFYLVHGMAAEGHAALHGLDPEALSQDDRADLPAIAAAFDLFEGRSAPVGVALDRLPAAPLWQAAARVATGGAVAPGLLAAAAETLTDAPPAWARAFAPGLREAAIEAGPEAAETAKRLADFSRTAAGYVGSAEDLYLDGRAEEAAGNTSAARALYMQTAEGLDRASARARLALAGIELSVRRPDYPRIRGYLERHRQSWRGDAIELQHLTLLARLYEETGALAPAVAVMGDIRTRFPGSEPALLAEGRSAQLLPRLYSEGEAGTPPLPEFLALHQSLSLAYAGSPAFAETWRGLADWLLKSGASDAAAGAYADLRAMLSHTGIAGPDRLADLVLAEAGALVAGGQGAQAVERLQAAGPLADPVREDARRTLLAQAADLAGLPDLALARPPESPAAADLRLRARLRAEEGDAEGAARELAALADRRPAGLEPRDAMALLVQARASGQPALARKAADRIARQGDTAAPRALAEAVLAPAPPKGPLHLKDARARLDAARTLLDDLATLDLPGLPPAATAAPETAPAN